MDACGKLIMECLLETKAATIIGFIGPIRITPDAKTCVFGYFRMLADLYLVEGLK